MRFMHFATCGLLLSAAAVRANNTTTVFSPEVKAGSSAFEYRFSFVPEDGVGDSFAHRFHYQRAINDTFRWRLIGLIGDSGPDQLEYRYARFELQHQFIESEDWGWDSAFRYELQIADGDDEPSRARLAWTSKWNWDSGWEARFNLLTGRQFGPYASEGWLLETRAQVTYPIAENWRLGVEMFNDFNDSDDFGGYSEQEHTIGPVLKGSIGDDWKVLAGVVFGVSSSADDSDFRLILTKSF